MPPAVPASLSGSTEKRALILPTLLATKGTGLWLRGSGESPLKRKERAMRIPSRMKAVVLVAPHRFELQDRPVPAPGPEDVLVRVHACGI